MSARSEAIAEVYNRLGSVAATARELGLAHSTVSYHLKKVSEAGEPAKPVAGGRLNATEVLTRPVPATGVSRYILTSAQNNTHVNDAVLDNLLALAGHYDAEFLCASYTYNKNAYGKLAVKPGTLQTSGEELWFDARIEPYLRASDQNIELAPGLIWCGRMNTLPTSPIPLNGFETYTGRKSGIFPHAKIALQSVASGKHEGVKMNYTTGTVTQMNYIQKAAGLKAEHHHTYGGLIVEVDSEGSWFVRQLVADDSGTIYDLDVVATNGEVHRELNVEAITWGDVHTAQLDMDVAELAWGEGGMLETLRPRQQFLHDLLDFRARNHHELKDPHQQFRLHLSGANSVERELADCARVLHWADRPWVQTYVVDANHDQAMTRWLKEADWKLDPVNAEFYLEANLRILQAIRANDRFFHVLEWALHRASAPRDRVVFLRQDESHVICKGPDGGIECGMHGDLGPNGARGNPRNLSKMGRRANTGHTHSAAIVDGMYVAGTSSKLDMGYNRGPSSWSHSHIVTYGNGKRAIITMWNGKWRA